jgi:hypothetical protein
MEEITVKYIDFTDLMNPQTIKGLFYIDYKPTTHSIPRNRRAFTIDGKPVTLGNLRYAEVRVDRHGDVFTTWEYIADHVEFLDRPSIYADVDPTLGQGAESRNPSSAARPQPTDDPCKWPNSPCWQILEIDRTKLPDNADEAKKVVTSQYRKLAKQHHPDLGGSEDAMKQVVAAKTEADSILQGASRGLVWA